jgi:nucleoside-diphosphate-sugar epimerase
MTLASARPGAVRLDPGIADRLTASRFRILITGASGWLGRATLDALTALPGFDIAARVQAFGSSARMLALPGGHSLRQQPLQALATLPPAPSLLLHFAFLTKDKALDMDETRYRDANRHIAETVESALDRSGTMALFLASSGAAAAASQPDASPSMRLYGGMKQDDEMRFAGWAERSGRRAVIARVFNLSGPHINKPEHYALASFILDALAGQTVAVRAPHRVERGHVAIADLLSVMFAELLEPEPGITRFETGGEPLELGELAARVATLLGAPGHSRAPITSARIDRYLGNDSVWQDLLTRHGLSAQAIDTQIQATAEFLAATQAGA